MLDDVTAALAAIEAEGGFAVELGLSSEALHVVVQGGAAALPDLGPQREGLAAAALVARLTGFPGARVRRVLGIQLARTVVLGLLVLRVVRILDVRALIVGAGLLAHEFLFLGASWAPVATVPVEPDFGSRRGRKSPGATRWRRFSDILGLVLPLCRLQTRYRPRQRDRHRLHARRPDRRGAAADPRPL